MMSNREIEINAKRHSERRRRILKILQSLRSFRMTRYGILAFCIVILIFAFLFLIFLKDRNVEAGELDKFAKCLAAKGAVMYGTAWCSHCQNEKAGFGDAFKYISYVECPENPQKCIDAGINGYPTWIFPASPTGGLEGRKLEGEQGLEKLAEESGCPQPW